MKRNRVVILTFVLFAILAITGCAAVNSLISSKEEETETITSRSFADWTNKELFANVPAMIVENTKIGDFEAATADTYRVDISGTKLEDYQEYLQLLEENGFSKHSDNGEDGLGGSVYTATYIKENLYITVTQVVKTEKTYIIVGEDLVLSENLFYKEKYIADNQAGAKTTLHMLEIYNYGCSFVIQLKNGHFIINDGGQKSDLLNLITYMESLVAEGEKPVVEAWFVSHAHTDHASCLKGFLEDASLIDRICVEAFYFNEPSDDSNYATNGTTFVLDFTINYKYLKNSKGEAPAMYCPMTGQRFYFNDITVEVVFGQEIHPIENYGDGYNDTSTWLMFNIEGQKLLLPGDAGWGSTQTVINMYESDFFELDVYAASHHGINVYDYFTDFASLKTVVYPNYRIGSLHASGFSSQATQNEYMIGQAKELISWGDGTKVLTFPYVVGTVETKVVDWSELGQDPNGKLTYDRLETYDTYILNE